MEYPSKISVPDSERTKLIDMLNVSLATTLDLASQLKQAHWTVKGRQFYSDHKLFDRLHKRLRKRADELAERAATLGGHPRGTVREASKISVIPEYDLEVVDGKQHLIALMARYAAFSKHLRDCADVAQSDVATQDLYIETLRKVELDLWFIESHLNV